ncbi:PKS3 [Auxenochlorella protothecoides x Auxenochlorella symbiontica]
MAIQNGTHTPEDTSTTRGIPDYRHSGPITLKYVKRGYHALCTHFLTLAAVPMAAVGLLELANMYKQGDLNDMWVVAKQTNLTFDLVSFIAGCSLLIFAAAAYIFTRKRPVYLLNYHCFKPDDSLKVSYKYFMEHSERIGAFTPESLEFQRKVLERSGLGEETYLPEAVMKNPPEPTMAAARGEANQVLFESVERVLAKTGISPKAVDILIVNCSLFNPTPSLSAMIVNHFGMRSNVITYNLSGMGCSAGVISLSLARELLQVYPRSTALVVSTENITQNWYFGNAKSMLIPNCLFRLGGAAMLLSNRRVDRWRAKLELLHVVRTHMGQDAAHYGCVYQQEDGAGQRGVHLSRELMRIAGHALKANITTLGPLVLPVSEQLLFFLNLVARKVLKRKGLKPYIPDFKLAFQHFCIHTGGRGVIDAIEQQLELGTRNAAPSRETLYRYGNISSASIWYVLANIETKQGLRKGDRIWQIAFGSGFKCNSAVWRALRTCNEQHGAWVEGGQAGGKAV